MNTLHRWLLTGAASLAFSPLVMAQQAPVTTAEFDRWMSEISNWGRWGAQDERGTLNLITPQKRQAAARLVRDGVSISLALDLNTRRDALNANPFEHSLTVGEFGGHEVAGDAYRVDYHGFAHSHMDGLPHFLHKGKMYNGVGAEVLEPGGATRLGIHNAHEGVFSRGVLVDVPWLLGVDYLEPGFAITAELLESWEERTGVRIGSGDVLLVRPAAGSGSGSRGNGTSWSGPRGCTRRLPNG